MPDRITYRIFQREDDAFTVEISQYGKVVTVIGQFPTEAEAEAWAIKLKNMRAEGAI